MAETPTPPNPEHPPSQPSKELVQPSARTSEGNRLSGILKSKIGGSARHRLTVIAQGGAPESVEEQGETTAIEQQKVTPVEAPKLPVVTADTKTSDLIQKSRDAESRSGAREGMSEGARKTLEAKQADPDRRKHLITLDKEEVGNNEAYLKALRDPNVVGKDKYGKGVVNDCHHKGETTHAAEQAQEHAAEKYQAKIDAGVADPAMIGSEMNQMLGAQTEVTDPPTSYEQVLPKVSAELQGFVEKGMITSQEAEVIKAEAETFSRLYQEGYADADPSKVYEVTRDISRMVAYQTRMDKNVLVGSDHGERHILRGNMKAADKVIESLEQQGVSVSPKDKVLVHAIIVMHDIGYTTGAAQSPEGFQAAQDHPVAGAAFVEANSGWASEMFGSDAVPVIREAILDHSYVGGKFESPRPEGSDINPELVRAITSVVDSVGVTAETKVPAFFNNPDTVGELFKIKLAGKMYGRDEEGKFASEEQKTAHDAVLVASKEKLRVIAEQSPNPRDRQAYLGAVASVNEKTTDVLGQFTGEVTDIKMVRHPDSGQLVPEIKMDLNDELGTQMRDMFGGSAELQQFVKAMKDLGITGGHMKHFHDVMEEARENKITPAEGAMTYTSEKAVVHVGTQEKVSEEFAQMRDVFGQAAEVTQEWKIVQTLESIDPQAENFGEQMAAVYGGLGALSGKESVKNALSDGTIFDQLQSADPGIQKEAAARLQTVLQADIDNYLLG